MISNTYEGMVRMKPETENRYFFSGDDNFTYQVPQVYFECNGEIDNSQLALDYRVNSVTMVKENCAVKFTEFDHYEILMTNSKGEPEWVDRIAADIMGWDVESFNEIRPVKSYFIEEFDWNKSEKRRYKVVLEDISKLEKYDASHLKKAIDRDSKDIGEEYVLADSDN